MSKKTFTRQALVDMIKAASESTDLTRKVSEGRYESRIQRRLIQIYGHRQIYAKGLRLGDFIEWGKNPSPAAPLTIFKSEGGVWSARVVIEVIKPDADPLHEDKMFGALDTFGVEYIPIPERHLDANYLISPDFKKRTKRAIFAPTKIPFRKFPAIPAGGWQPRNETQDATT